MSALESFQPTSDNDNSKGGDGVGDGVGDGGGSGSMNNNTDNEY